MAWKINFEFTWANVLITPIDDMHDTIDDQC